MEIEVTKVKHIRFKSERDRDKYIAQTYPDKVEDKFERGLYWTDDSKSRKITAIWNTIEVRDVPVIHEV